MTRNPTRTKRFLTRSALFGALMALGCGSALAESQYGYSATGTGTVTAQADINLSVTVPKLILLRVGSSGATIDTLSWTAGFSIPATPTVPTATANNVVVNWNGAAPTTSAITNPAAVAVNAWTNAAGGGTLSYTATAFGAGGPTLANITVTSAAGLAHPTPATLATTSTASSTFATTTLATGSWTYALTGTPASWQAGAYTSTVIYTATGI